MSLTFGKRNMLRCENQGNISCMQEKLFSSATQKCGFVCIQLMDWVERSGWNNVTLQASSISIIYISLTSMYPFLCGSVQSQACKRSLNDCLISHWFMHFIIFFIGLSIEKPYKMMKLKLKSRFWVKCVHFKVKLKCTKQLISTQICYM